MKTAAWNGKHGKSIVMGKEMFLDYTNWVQRGFPSEKKGNVIHIIAQGQPEVFLWSQTSQTPLSLSEAASDTNSATHNYWRLKSSFIHYNNISKRSKCSNRNHPKCEKVLETFWNSIFIFRSLPGLDWKHQRVVWYTALPSNLTSNALPYLTWFAHCCAKYCKCNVSLIREG